MKYLLLLTILLFSQPLFATEILSKKDFLKKTSFDCEKEYLLDDWSIGTNPNVDEEIVNHFIDKIGLLKPNSLRLIGYADMQTGTMNDSVNAAGKRLENVEKLISQRNSSLIIHSYSPKRMKSNQINNITDNKNQRTVSFTLSSCKPPTLKFAAAKKDGIYYEIAEQFEKFRKNNYENLNYSFDLLTTNGSSDILNSLDKGEADLGFATETSILEHNGEIQPIFEIWPDYIFFITTDKFSAGNQNITYTELEKIIKNNQDDICFGVNGSSTQLATKKIFDKLNLANLKSACKDSDSEYLNKKQLKDLGKGEYALVVISVAHPADFLLDAFEINKYSFVNSGGFRIVDFQNHVLHKELKRRPFSIEEVNSQKNCTNDYNQIKSCDIMTFTESNYLVASKKFLENEKLTSNFIENFSLLIKTEGDKNPYLNQAKERFCSNKNQNIDISKKIKDQPQYLKDLIKNKCELNGSS